MGPERDEEIVSDRVLLEEEIARYSRIYIEDQITCKRRKRRMRR
jgi:hypothetical protein